MPQIHRLIRCKRKSLALIVTDEAKLVIRAPHRLSERDILRFVDRKRGWIEAKMAEISRRPRPRVLSEAEKDTYRALARRIIPERVRYYSELTGLRPGKVRINNAKKRWGSCGARGSLNFPWRLVLTSPEVIDYVVVHELVHLVERNHSKRFWRRVEQILPDYRVRRKWLKLGGRSSVSPPVS
jgi:predicted metal-dependent hydrolase